MKRTLIFAAAAAALMLGACTKTGKVETPEFITVSSGIGSMSKVTTAADGSQTFSTGDVISIYAWIGNPAVAPAADARVVDNSLNKLDPDGNWIASPQMLWKNLTDKHYFIGIYPSKAQSVTDLAQLSHTVNVADQTSSDILIASELAGKIAQSNPVPLTFDHVMAKVSIELSYRNQWADEYKDQGGIPDVEEVSIADVASDATVNCLTKAVTAGAAKAAVAIPAVENNKKYVSVIVPQTGVKSVTVKIKGRNYTYTHGEDFKLESGKVTTIKLIVGRNQIDLGDVQINDWTSGETIEGGEALD